MGLELANYEERAHEAVKAFWGNRAAAIEKQKLKGKVDQGERAGVTAGKNMDGFVTLLVDLVEKNGLKDAEIHLKRQVLTLPGYFKAHQTLGRAHYPARQAHRRTRTEVAHRSIVRQQLQ